MLREKKTRSFTQVRQTRDHVQWYTILSILWNFNDFIHLTSRLIWSTSVAEVISGKYYSIIVNSTPDITQVVSNPKLVFAVCYVNKTGVPVS